MGDAAHADAEARYLSGDLDFEGALREVSGSDIDRSELAQILHGFRKALPAAGPALSDHDARLLTKAGFVTDAASATAVRVDRDIRMRGLVRNSLSIPAAAERLGVTAARVRQRLTDRTLWAFQSGRNRLLPPAQFTDTGAVPYFEQVAPLLAEDLHPLTVQALLTRPQPTLAVDGEPVSIVQWLIGCAGTAAEIEQVTDLVITSEWESA
ncbi:hypothetical protein [Rhodococcus sp. NPDC058521]|uniref:hypothetical protein n=1 Tax=Rhodococcus sp. NPDC058521 TaxID=3346536 RepID=UPI00365A8D71